MLKINRVVIKLVFVNDNQIVPLELNLDEEQPLYPNETKVTNKIKFLDSLKTYYLNFNISDNHISNYISVVNKFLDWISKFRTKQLKYPINFIIKFCHNNIKPVPWCTDLISFVGTALNKPVISVEDDVQVEHKPFNIQEKNIHYEFKYISPTKCTLHITKDTISE